MKIDNREQPTGTPANVSHEMIDLGSESDVGSPLNTSLQDISKDKLASVLTDTVTLSNTAEMNETTAPGFDDTVETIAETSPKETESLGKFKSVQALLDAYTNLEAEFTKKCQKLREKELETMKGVTPTFNLEESLAHFLATNNAASAFSDELRNYISQHPELAKVENPFESAWAGLVYNHVQNYQKEKNDPIVNQYVLSNDAVRQTVLESYLDALKQQKSPIVISSQQGERVSGALNPDTPTTLHDAKAIVEKMFS